MLKYTTFMQCYPVQQVQSKPKCPKTFMVVHFYSIAYHMAWEFPYHKSLYYERNKWKSQDIHIFSTPITISLLVIMSVVVIVSVVVVVVIIIIISSSIISIISSFLLLLFHHIINIVIILIIIIIIS